MAAPNLFTPFSAGRGAPPNYSGPNPFRPGRNQFGPKPPRVRAPRTKGFKAGSGNVIGGPVRRSVPGTPATRLATPGGAAAAPTTSATTEAKPSPLDATYWSNVGTNMFKVRQGIGTDIRNIGDIRTGLASSLGALNYQQPYDALAMMEGANRSGALYSTAEGMNQGHLAHTYATKAADLTRVANQKIGGLQANITSLLSGVPIYNTAQAIASAGRTSALDQKNPATGQKPVANPQTGPGGTGVVTAGRVSNLPTRSQVGLQRQQRQGNRQRLASSIARQRGLEGQTRGRTRGTGRNTLNRVRPSKAKAPSTKGFKGASPNFSGGKPGRNY